ncbi:hypothetical protein LPTSP3_g18210 [Leptospira kobayashii]|uniref:Lipoprotein n=1 Tax=Leptospira kobayashii TaxID=1917830 RepID=A0ABM7UJE1_9LEPT|nr:hypothetical protein [Leptospira kobayashii]BDA78891.1 hypothetical protein LPTSP3_g18210 [Leptospira kobayashii]
MDIKVKIFLFFSGFLSLCFYFFLYAYQLPSLISSNEDSKVLLGLGVLVISWIPPIVGWIAKDHFKNWIKETHEK